MVVSYCRVSTTEQNVERQIAEIKKRYDVEEFFIDKMSGKNAQRPELQRMLSFVRRGDIVVISEFSRLGRNVLDLLTITQQFSEKGVELVSLKENLDTSSPSGRFFIAITAAMSALQREYILISQKEGIELAKEKGLYKGRKPITHPDFEKVVRVWRSGEITAVEAMKRLGGMKPTTFYRKVKEYEWKGCYSSKGNDKACQISINNKKYDYVFWEGQNMKKEKEKV